MGRLAVHKRPLPPTKCRVASLSLSQTEHKTTHPNQQLTIGTTVAININKDND